MSRTVTIFEHGETSGFGWKDRDLISLDRLHRAIGAEILQPVVRGGGLRELRATQFVGVVRLGSRTVQILPKIHRATNELTDAKEVARQATRNLLRLLEYAGDLSVREHGLARLL